MGTEFLCVFPAEREWIGWSNAEKQVREPARGRDGRRDADREAERVRTKRSACARSSLLASVCGTNTCGFGCSE